MKKINKYKMVFLILFLIESICMSSCNSQSNTNKDTPTKAITESGKNLEKDFIDEEIIFDCNYLGQITPEDTPLKFADGIISTNIDEYNFEISSCGKFMVFARNADIYLLEYDQNTNAWSKPFIASFSSRDIEGEPCFSPNGTRIYFSSRKVIPESKFQSNLYYSDYENGIWNNPQLVTDIKPVHKPIHAITFAKNGNAYDSGLVQYKNNEVIELIPKTSGSHPFVSPDDSFIIYPARKSGKRDKDLFIIYKLTDGTWSLPIDIGDKINSNSNETSPFVTPDNKYLFFGRKYDFYWVKADFIDQSKLKDYFK